jgi:hypothetical protein
MGVASGFGEGRAGMLTVLDRLSLPGSPDRPNEDAFGVAGDWAWVLDGSIPPGVPPIMGEASDAVWLVRFAGERFAALTRGCADGRALIARVIGEARDTFLAKAPEERRESLTWPAAALTLVRGVGDRLDAWTLADTVALVRRPDGAVSALNDAPALRAFETDAAADMLKRTGTDPESVRATPEFRVWMEAGRRARPGGGVHGFGLRTEALGRLRQEAAAVSPGTVVLLASDGFAALSDAYGCCDSAGLMEAALARGLAPLGRELRRVETEVDPSGRRFPRFKRSDDATALLMRVG